MTNSRERPKGFSVRLFLPEGGPVGVEIPLLRYRFFESLPTPTNLKFILTGKNIMIRGGTK